jgi:hypothetical protein
MKEWTTALVLFALAEVTALLAIGHVDLAAVRVPLGIVTVGFAPGWLLLQRTRYDGSQLEQIGVGALLSLAISVLTCLVLLLSGIGITPTATTIALGVVVALLALAPGPRSGWVAVPARRQAMIAALGLALLTAGSVGALAVTPRSPNAADGPLAVGLRVQRTVDGGRIVHVDVLGDDSKQLQLAVQVAGRPKLVLVRAGRSGGRNWGAAFRQNRADARKKLRVTLVRGGRELRTATLAPSGRRP